MGKILDVRNPELHDILADGTELMQHGIITGFNFDYKTGAPGLELVVHYYHNVEEHVQRFLTAVQNDFSQAFGEEISHKEGKKWGLFKWGKKFIDEPGNRYFILHPGEQLKLESIKFNEIASRIDNEFVIGKDRAYAVTFETSDASRARFMIDLVRKYAFHYLTPDVKNPSRIDDAAHEKPLFMLSDPQEKVSQKSDLDRVYRLQLNKGRKIIWSLVQEKDFFTVDQRAKNFQCYPSLTKTTVYMDKNFFSDYG